MLAVIPWWALNLLIAVLIATASLAVGVYVGSCIQWRRITRWMLEFDRERLTPEGHEVREQGS